MAHEYLLITLGLLFLAGLLADQIGRLTSLPRVTMLLLLGMAAGPSGLEILPDEASEWFPLLSVIALTMVAFLLGGELTLTNLRRHGRAIFAISISITIGTTLIVWYGLVLLGVTSGLALLLGAIATATAPAAISDVIRQSGIENRFSRTLGGIVAIDDVWGLLVFSLALAIVHQGGGWAGPLLGAALEIGAALAIGALIGLPAAFLTGRLSPGEPLQTEAIGVVLLTAGFSIWMDASYLIAGMTAGALVANLARHHDFAFNEIEHIEWPFMVLFFLLAGATLELTSLWTYGWFTLAYVCLRIVARLAAAEFAARLVHLPPAERHAYGPALLPQAGVAVGMALVAAETVPQWGPNIVTITIAATVVFELIGPPATLAALRFVERKQRAERDDPG